MFMHLLSTYNLDLAHTCRGRVLCVWSKWPDHIALPFSILCHSAVCHLTIDCSFLDLQQSSTERNVEKRLCGQRLCRMHWWTLNLNVSWLAILCYFAVILFQTFEHGLQFLQILQFLCLLKIFVSKRGGLSDVVPWKGHLVWRAVPDCCPYMGPQAPSEAGNTWFGTCPNMEIYHFDLHGPSQYGGFLAGWLPTGAKKFKEQLCWNFTWIPWKKRKICNWKINDIQNILILMHGVNKWAVVVIV